MRYCLVLMVCLLTGCGSATQVETSAAAAAELGAETGLSGQPAWFPLDEEVYFTRDIEEAQAAALSFRHQPRWFMGDEDLLPYPKTLSDVPQTDRGTTLHFDVEEEKAADLLRFNVTLKAGERTVFREVEHRWNNTVPLLFAFYADGQAMPPRAVDFGKAGGVNQWAPLAKAGEEKRWSLLVNTESILALLPTKDARTVTVVAAFCEHQHEGYWPGEEVRRLLRRTSGSSDPDENDAIRHPILIRSNVVRLRWDGKTWAALGAN